jgi:hypothetical protein
MANENQNTGTNTGGINDTSGARENIKNQGDYNNILNESKNLLKKMVSSYDSIQGRIESLSKGSVNLKQINQELLKAKQKDYIVSQKLEESQKQLVARGGDRLDGAKEYLRSLEQIAKANEEDKDALEDISKALLANLDVEQQSFVNLKLANDLNKDALQYGKDKLAQEKRINDSIGISGKLLGGFAKKLGLGNEIYESMVENAKDLEKIDGKLSFFDKAKYLGKAGLSSIGESLKDPLTMLPIIGTAIAGVVSGFMKLVEFALSAQDRTIKFGRALGMSADSAVKVRNEFSKIAFQSNSIFINSEKLMQSQEELTGILGTNNILSGKILETNSLLKDIAGLEAETRGEIVQSSIITGKSVEATTKSVLAQVVGLQKATGIGFNFQKILKEASSLGGYLGLSFAKYPDKLTKSLVTVKAMGLELKQLDSMADSFLDFESSISNEFEAQLLTGKNINLMKAREAFLNNDLAGAAAEITSQVGSSGDFLKMNRIQAESLSKAFGMSRDQLGEMLKKQELLSRIGAKDTDNAQKQLQIGLQKFGNQKALAEAVGEEAYNSMLNASAQEKISAFMEKIKQSIADFVTNSPLIPMIERAIDFLSKPSNIQKIISYVQSGFALIFDIVGKTAGVMMKLGNFFGAGISEDLISTVMAGGDSIRAMNLSGPVTVGANKVKNETGMSSQSAAPMSAPPAIAPENKMNILVQNDMMTGKSVVTFLNTDPGTRFDKSNIIYAS